MTIAICITKIANKNVRCSLNSVSWPILFFCLWSNSNEKRETTTWKWSTRIETNFSRQKKNGVKINERVETEILDWMPLLTYFHGTWFRFDVVKQQIFTGKREKNFATLWHRLVMHVYFMSFHLHPFIRPIAPLLFLIHLTWVQKTFIDNNKPTLCIDSHKKKRKKSNITSNRQKRKRFAYKRHLKEPEKTTEILCRTRADVVPLHTWHTHRSAAATF